MFHNSKSVDLIGLDKLCPPNFKKRDWLRPDKRCKHRYTFTNQGELKVNISEPYSTSRFCIDVNGNAKHIDEHPAVICVDDKVEKDYL